MKTILFDEHNVITQVEPTANPRKLTGSRVGTILGMNPYGTEFEEWLHMTKVKSKEFVGNKYTNAGNVIESIIINHLNKTDDMFTYLSAEEVYGPEPYKTTQGDFYKEHNIFGGMWDALLMVKGSNKPVGIVEVKTTQRAEDWVDGIPSYYQVQAELYAYLEGVDVITFPVAFLSDVDYIFPEDFVPIEGENFQVFTYRIGPTEWEQINARIDYSKDWWNKHILTGISPVPSDHKVDLELLDILKTEEFENNDIETLLTKYNDIESMLDEMKDDESVAKYLSTTKSHDALKKNIRSVLVDNHPKSADVDTLTATVGDTNVSLKRTVKVTEKFNMDEFKKAHPELYMEYVIIEEKESFRQSFKKIEKENE